MTARGIVVLMRPVWAASWHHWSKQLSIAITGHVAASRSSIDTSSMLCLSEPMTSYSLLAPYWFGLMLHTYVCVKVFHMLMINFRTFSCLNSYPVLHIYDSITLIFSSALTTASWIIPLNTSGLSFPSSLE